ncbi:unnamed protein product [Ilex paraguariensis]|uniref:CsbD family protein n=1 Tax=Ilex paraguariensis TaxID=185542 RepID=A0ABC8UEW6_9AQUA
MEKSGGPRGSSAGQGNNHDGSKNAEGVRDFEAHVRRSFGEASGRLGDAIKRKGDLGSTIKIKGELGEAIRREGELGDAIRREGELGGAEVLALGGANQPLDRLGGVAESGMFVRTLEY